MSVHRINVFISHSWCYSNHYDTLEKWIFGEKWSSGSASLDFHDFSVPKDYPITNFTTDKQLRDAIYDKIARSHVVVIPTGMYANYGNYILDKAGPLGYFKYQGVKPCPATI
ncbi:TIR domain-containing protein [Asticcacaulis taihuensis]|uniref:TIR domain-containing protein n=1 Tax=Asticcacaulis taihuensis TaxID=260084 RepID=UPI0026EFB134|nr:TIR domain-containing protein [Asticcacaulis taihuensis]